MKQRRKIILFKDVVVLQGPSSCCHCLLCVKQNAIDSVHTHCKYSPSPCSTTCMSLGSCPPINTVTEGFIFYFIHSCNFSSYWHSLGVFPCINSSLDTLPDSKCLLHIFCNVHLTVIGMIWTVILVIKLIRTKTHLWRCGGPARFEFLLSLREEQAVSDNKWNADIDEIFRNYFHSNHIRIWIN